MLPIPEFRRHFVVYWGDSPAGTIIFDIPYEEMGKRATFVLGDGDGRVSGPLNVEKVVRK